jgi:hypothetical protein
MRIHVGSVVCVGRGIIRGIAEWRKEAQRK